MARVALALALALAAALPAAADMAPPFEVEPIIDCRARAITQLNLADWDAVTVDEGATRAILEQANFALILGLWGAPLTSVEAATNDMRDGENLLIESATLINRYAAEWQSNGPYDSQLITCAGVVWDAAKIVVDRILDQGLTRDR